jgi:hypothetical protein
MPLGRRQRHKNIQMRCMRSQDNSISHLKKQRGYVPPCICNSNRPSHRGEGADSLGGVGIRVLVEGRRRARETKTDAPTLDPCV